MTIWLQALTLAAVGDVAAALERVSLDMSLELRRYVEDSHGSRTYAGPVARAVSAYAAKQDSAEQRLLVSYRDDLVDWIVDDVLASVERSVRLVEICCAAPGIAVDDVSLRFPWAPGLKRDSAWKRAWLADMLRSMLAAGVPLPGSVAEALGDAGEARFGFDEVAFASSPERVKLSWADFKREREVGAGFLCLVPDEEDEGVANEAMDFRSVRLADVSRRLHSQTDVALAIDLHRVGERLTGDLAGLLERFHAEKPVDGYRPVAWHNVFWTVTEEYEGLRMALVLLDPCLDRDGELAEHIRAAYPEVKSCSRVAVLRRRQALHGACVARIHERLAEVAG